MFEYRTKTETVKWKLGKYDSPDNYVTDNTPDYTERIEGCRFYQQDILLFDYTYSGDCEVFCKLDYFSPGFGLVIAEYTADIADSEYVYVFEITGDCKYRIAKKTKLKGTEIIRDSYIEGIQIVPSKQNYKALELTFKFTDNNTIQLWHKNYNYPLFSYVIENDILDYKIGFYSNSGNIIRDAIIYSETPSGWSYNIDNAQGGRINWFDDGFELEDCDGICEVENQNIELAAGTYFLSFKSSSKDIKYYMYNTAQKYSFEDNFSDILTSSSINPYRHRGKFRFLSEDTKYKVATKVKNDDGTYTWEVLDRYLTKINESEKDKDSKGNYPDSIADPEKESENLAKNQWIDDTRWDDDNDIINRKKLVISDKDDEDMYTFNGLYITLTEQSTLSLKFAGSDVKVSDIAIKQYENDDFVETDSTNTTREASYILLDINQDKTESKTIKNATIRAMITAIPTGDRADEDFYLTKNHTTVIDMHTAGIKLNEEFTIVIDAVNRTIAINGNIIELEEKATSDESYDKLYLFNNIDATIYAFSVIYNAKGNVPETTIDLLAQKTFLVSIENNVESPFIVDNYPTDEELEKIKKNNTEFESAPLDLSSSYREVCDDYEAVEKFLSASELKLSNNLISNRFIEVYGNKTETNLDNLTVDSSDLVLLDQYDYSIDYTNDKILVTQDAQARYASFLVRYKYNDDDIQIDVFSKYRELKLSKQIILNTDVTVKGYVSGTINKDANNIKDIGATCADITSYTIDYVNNVVKIDWNIKSQYKYIIIEYQHCENFYYEFTNYNRQLVDLSDNSLVYLDSDYCDGINTIMIYGIPKDAVFREDLLYRVKDTSSMTKIDYCTSLWNYITSYSITRTNRIAFDDDDNIRSKYKYIIIEYLKDDSYTVNEREASYEIDVATSRNNLVVYYDADDSNVTHKYSSINYDIDGAEENTFINLIANDKKAEY